MAFTPPADNSGTLSGWSIVTPGSAVASIAAEDIGYGLNGNHRLAANSGYGCVVSWGSTAPGASEYLKSTINYAAIKKYGVFTNKKPLYFNFDQFFYEQDYSSSLEVAQVVVASSTSRTLANISITSNIATATTLTNPGFAVGETITLANVDKVITVTNKARTLTTVTLTFASQTHQIIVGDLVVVSISDANYDGTYTVVAQTATTISYAKTSGTTQTTTAASGTITQTLFNGNRVITAVNSTSSPYSYSFALTHANYASRATTGTATLSGKTISSATPRVAIKTAVPHGLSVGDYVYISDQLYYTGDSVLLSQNESVFSYVRPPLGFDNYTGGSFLVSDVVGSDWFCYEYYQPISTEVGTVTIDPVVDTYTLTSSYISQEGSGPYTYTLSFTLPHGFQIGDYVDITVNNKATGELMAWGDGSSYQITDVTERSISYSDASTSGYGYTTEYSTSISESNSVKVYRQYGAVAYNLENILIQLGSDSTKTCSLYDVLSVTELALWSEESEASFWDVKKVRFIDQDIYRMSKLNKMPNYREYVPQMLGIYGDSELVLDSEKLYEKYLQLNPEGLLAEEDLYILFPTRSGVVTSYDFYGADPAVYADTPVTSSTLSVGFVIDNVKISTAAEFFFGDSGTDTYSWSDVDNAPDSPSVRSTKKWIDVDLESSTASYEVNNLFITDPTYSLPTFAKGFIGVDEIEIGRPTDSINPTPYPSSTYTSTGISSAEIYRRQSSIPSAQYFLRSSLNLVSSENLAMLDLRSKIRSSGSLDAAAGMTASLNAATGLASISMYGDSIYLLGADGEAPKSPPLHLQYKVDQYAYYSETMPVSPGDLSKDSHSIRYFTGIDAVTTSTTYQFQTSGSGDATVLTGNSCYVVFKTGPTGAVQYSYSASIDVTNTSYRTTVLAHFYVFTTVNASGHPYIGTPTTNAIFTDAMGLITGTTAAYPWSATSIFYGEPNTQYVMALGVKTSNAASTATAYAREVSVIPLY